MNPLVTSYVLTVLFWADVVVSGYLVLVGLIELIDWFLRRK